MLAISAFFVKYGLFIIPVLAVGVVFLIRWFKTPSGKKLIDTIALKVPMLKSIVQKVAVARFARTFSALMGLSRGTTGAGK